MSEKIDILTNNAVSTNYQQVIEAHNRLNKQIDAMNTKIANTMDKNQGQFVLAYQNHIRKIKIQLSQIKSKSDAQEKQLSKNDRVAFMEKQVSIFRQEALKLYDRVQEKQQESQIFRLRCKDLEKSFFIAQRQVKESMRQKKLIQAKLIESQSRVAQLQQQLRNKRQLLSKRPIYSQQSNTKSILVNNLNTRLKQQQKLLYSVSKQTNEPTASKTVPLGLGLRRRSINQSAGNTFGSTQFVSNKNDGQLKQWFLQCIKAIKKDVAQRKNVGEQLDLEYVKDIDEFKMVDKLRLLQKFMENQKLLIWMYEKIFPSRLAEVRDYLSKNNNDTALGSAKKQNSHHSQQILAQPEIFEQLGGQKMEVVFPKMSQIKHRKSEVRNKILIKDGKLNVTMS